ncbi:uncharacterized protein LOC117103085 [Anneissia japonica]|uniref:uncharacterized protein LOC117103085 n=1 Tax=Anneissia japonica TaxID=1529436 RepID=UPI0014259C5F|nr:uncharacterized protein LOC117103085 [Anneissia japonica]
MVGSSSGVGEAIAIHLASLGYRLTVAGRNAENLLKVVNKCKEQGLADKEVQDDRILAEEPLFFWFQWYLSQFTRQDVKTNTPEHPPTTAAVSTQEEAGTLMIPHGIEVASESGNDTDWFVLIFRRLPQLGMNTGICAVFSERRKDLLKMPCSTSHFNFKNVMDLAKKVHVLQKRPIKFDEVTAAVAFLASEHAAMITGCILPIDGGYHLVN